MMALAIHQLQGSCSTLPSVPSSWRRGSKVKHFVPTFRAVGKKDHLISLKCSSCSSVGAPLVLGSKSKIFRISAFKGKSRHDGSKVKVTYLQHEGEESSVDPSKVQNVVPAPYTAADETGNRSMAIQNLFKIWLTLLHTPSQTCPVEEVLEKSTSMETSETTSTVQRKERGEILKAVWCYFLGLDATIKIPLLIFTPLYLAINLIYGSEVSKELTPLWIIGPLIVALYIKMFRAICGLYIFSFKQSIKVVKNLPSYCVLVHDYIFHGKLKEAIQTHLWQPLVDIKNADYKKVARQKMKDFRELLVEKYLDFVESIWPYYCRTIRFLKRANLI